MSDGAHLLIPLASSSDEGCARARRELELELPRLERLLARLTPAGTDAGDEHSLSMPHERVLAREYGLQAPDGCLPWAAWQVAQSGRTAGSDAWAWITPCHWRVGRDHIAMDAPGQLELSAQHSQALLDAMRPYFEQDGIELHYDSPTLWLARGDIFRGMASASTDRVVGRVVDPWLPRDASMKTIRRLQQEMQMLLYTHPVNEARTQGGQLPVNSFWVSGTGALPSDAASRPAENLRIISSLRDCALRGDWPGWAAAWQQVDAQDCAAWLADLDRGAPVRLTLCGERSARTWSGRGNSLMGRIGALLRGRQALSVLETL